MTISRRDTIIIAVLINIGLMSILLMTAMHVDENPMVDKSEFRHSIAEVREELPRSVPISTTAETPTDEVDKVINDYHARIQQQEIPSEASQQQDEQVEIEEKYVEIMIKRGDALEKIARANGTTIREIRKLNDLNSDFISIGQKLRVPVGTIQREEKPAEQTHDDDGVYYVIKKDDNPWKIARKFHVKYEDILRLNELNEDNARNLKVGDTIRVK